MPIIFAGVGGTLLLVYAGTLAAAYFHFLPTGLHMLWGLSITILLVLFQCLIFGFFIGSGKSIKKVVLENGLGREWIERTKDYKNKCYPALMLAILVTAAAGIIGGGVATGVVPAGVHQALVWAAFLSNGYSFWVSYRVLVENVEAIHAINREIYEGKMEKPAAAATADAESPSPLKDRPGPPVSAKLYFLAAASWVPYLYLKWSLGSRTIPFWPFLALSGVFLFLGFLSRPKDI